MVVWGIQGQYAFVIYDSRRKQVFAARDPTGSLPLFVAFGDEGSVSFANNPAAVPPTHDAYDEVRPLRSLFCCDSGVIW
jgi:asparagine synthetase B (glutamine-hydrolysing)